MVAGMIGFKGISAARKQLEEAGLLEARKWGLNVFKVLGLNL